MVRTSEMGGGMLDVDGLGASWMDSCCLVDGMCPDANDDAIEVDNVGVEASLMRRGEEWGYT